MASSSSSESTTKGIHIFFSHNFLSVFFFSFRKNQHDSIMLLRFSSTQKEKARENKGEVYLLLLACCWKERYHQKIKEG